MRNPSVCHLSRGDLVTTGTPQRAETMGFLWQLVRLRTAVAGVDLRSHSPASLAYRKHSIISDKLNFGARDSSKHKGMKGRIHSCVICSANYIFPTKSRTCGLKIVFMRTKYLTSLLHWNTHPCHCHLCEVPYSTEGHYVQVPGIQRTSLGSLSKPLTLPKYRPP